MTAFASVPADERRIYFEQAAATLDLSPVLVEKDFWVTWTLARIFQLSDLGERLIFKGGTSLSKVYNAIERFSEDIDLQLPPDILGIDEADLWGPSKTQRQKKSKLLNEICTDYVRNSFRATLEDAIAAVLGAPVAGATWLTYEFDERVKSGVLWLTYPTSLDQGLEYVRRAIKLEPGSLADQQPVERATVEALVARLGGTDEFDDLRAEITAMTLGRTFWEKATILHIQNSGASQKEPPERYSRHYYDFARLWQHADRPVMAADLSTLAAVVRMKSAFFPDKNYESAIVPNLLLMPPDHRARALAADYQAMREMLFGDVPTFDDILAVLTEAEREINAQ